jgi:hypothetical protein
MENAINKILIIQNQIFDLMNAKNGVSVHFRYDRTELSLITYNKANNEFFLVKSFSGTGNRSLEQELGLNEKMLEYVLHLIKNIDKNKTNDTIGNSYTVNWKKNNDATQTSYFYGSDMEDVIIKFYYGKESIKHMFNIFEIKLNPIA